MRYADEFGLFDGFASPAVEGVVGLEAGHAASGLEGEGTDEVGENVREDVVREIGKIGNG